MRQGAGTVVRHWYLAVLVYALAFVVPAFDPTYPTTGIDANWRTALGEALARHLVFGRDLVFTYGPYGPADTGEYHPDLPWLGIGGGLVLALGYVVAALVLLERRRWASLGLALVLVAGLATFDALSLAYPLVAVLAIHRLVSAGDPASWRTRDRVRLVLLLVPIGLLPLVKLSSAPTALAGLVAATVLLARHRRWIDMVLCWVVPALTLPALWWAAGQPLGAIDEYVVTAIPTITGYGQAMSIPGNNGQLFLFLFAALVAVLTLLARSTMSPVERIVVTAMVTTTLFVGLKAGFIRHDQHVQIVVFPLIVTGLAVASYLSRRGQQAIVLAACLLVAVPLYLFNLPYGENVAATVWHSTTSGPVGLVERVADRDALDRRYEKARAEIREEDLVPRLSGGTDVDLYPYDLAGLFAQDADWNPRPVFQSYGAYTPKLQELNAAHLRGRRAPGTVLFSVHPIDGRLPALEDAPSWLPLLEHYQVTSHDTDDDYLVLERRTPALDLRESGTRERLSGRLGQQLELPVHTRGLLASFDVRPSVMGRLRNLVWKTPPMKITLTFADGHERRFRFVPEMARAGFLLSPLVRDEVDFAGLLGVGTDTEPPVRVRAIRLDALVAPSAWDAEYDIELTRVDVRSVATAAPRARPGSPTG